MKFEAFVAFRYLRAKRKQTMVSVISLISILGISAGVMALVIAMSLETGFKEDIQSKILRVTSAVNLLKRDGSPILRYEEVLQRTRSLPRVTGSAPAIFKPVYVASPYGNQIAALKGIDPDLEVQLSDFFSCVIEGDPDALKKQPAQSQANGLPPLESILIGKEMARSLGVAVGHTLEVPVRKVTPMGTTISEKTLRVAAIFESGFWDVDSNWAYVHIDTARRLFSFPKESALILQYKIDDLEDAAVVADSIRERAGPGFDTNTWIELNKSIFAALKFEKVILFITIGLIVFVAALNIVTTLIMMVLEKQGDIAILTAMGATVKTIQRVFMLQGLVIGLIGTAIGNILGIAISWILDTYKLIQLEAEIYGIPYVPFHVRTWDVVIISVTAILISYLATIYPARNASKLDPVEVLRYE